MKERRGKRLGGKKRGHRGCRASERATRITEQNRRKKRSFVSLFLDRVNQCGWKREDQRLTREEPIFNAPFFFSLPFSASPSLPRTPTTEIGRPKPRSSRRRKTTSVAAAAARRERSTKTSWSTTTTTAQPPRRRRLPTATGHPGRMAAPTATPPRRTARRAPSVLPRRGRPRRAGGAAAERKRTRPERAARPCPPRCPRRPRGRSPDSVRVEHGGRETLRIAHYLAINIMTALHSIPLTTFVRALLQATRSPTAFHHREPSSTDSGPRFRGRWTLRARCRRGWSPENRKCWYYQQLAESKQVIMVPQNPFQGVLFSRQRGRSTKTRTFPLGCPHGTRNSASRPQDKHIAAW